MVAPVHDEGALYTRSKNALKKIKKKNRAGMKFVVRKISDLPTLSVEE
jgi:hypothetical protein